jgi:hypothetical protein
MLVYKYSNIASGATPIGSAERAPDKGWDNQYQGWRKYIIQISTT